MCDASGEHAETLQFLRVLQLLFEPFPLGNVTDVQLNQLLARFRIGIPDYLDLHRAPGVRIQSHIQPDETLFTNLFERAFEFAHAAEGVDFRECSAHKLLPPLVA